MLPEKKGEARNVELLHGPAQQKTPFGVATGTDILYVMFPFAPGIMPTYQCFVAQLLVGKQGREKAHLLGLLGGYDKAKAPWWSWLSRY
jgi:hypothetical protein